MAPLTHVFIVWHVARFLYIKAPCSVCYVCKYCSAQLGSFFVLRMQVLRMALRGMDKSIPLSSIMLCGMLTEPAKEGLDALLVDKVAINGDVLDEDRGLGILAQRLMHTANIHTPTKAGSRHVA